MTFEWWLRVFELPALAGLLWLVLQTRASVERDNRALRDQLHDHKVHVAQSYVQHEHVRMIEVRILDRLGNIERKLDRVIERRLGETEIA